MKNVLPLEFSKEAEVEFLEHYNSYENELSGLGEKFIFELEKVLSSIQKTPNGFQVFHNNSRQVPLNIFPFVLIYQVFENKILILAIFMAKQSPKKKIRA